MCIGLLSSLSAQGAADVSSLSAEIEAANRSGGGTITLTADIILTEALPHIAADITIEGNDNSISGGGTFPIFVVNGGALTISNLTLADGYSTDDGGAILIRNGAELVVESSTFENNRTDKGGGAISTKGGRDVLSISNSIFRSNYAYSGGGAVLGQGGTVEVSGSSFYDNNARRFGGAIEAFAGRVNVENSTFYNNWALEAGGIYVSGAATTLTHLTMLDNFAIDTGDTILKRAGRLHLRNSIIAGSEDTLDCVGGIDDSQGNFSQDGSCSPKPDGDPMLTKSTGSPGAFELLDGSPAVDAALAEFCLTTDQVGQARPVGGGCDIGAFESLTASPAEAERVPPFVCTLYDHILSANTNTSVGDCPAGTSHDIIHLTKDITLNKRLPLITGTITIEGNGFTISGDNRFPLFVVIGRKLTLKNLTLADGYSGEDGGAILVQTGAELVVENVTFARNRSEKGGGAISTAPASVGLSISDSVFEDNRAESGGGAVLSFGGTTEIVNSAFIANEAGRFGGGVEAFVGRVNISNSTFYRNRAGVGGGILVSGATTTMTHLTLSDNVANQGEGAGIFRRDGRAYLRNSIVSGGGTAPDCVGGLSQSRGNLSQDGTCAPLPGGDPLLGELTGSPGYLPLLDGSPAVDTAEAEFCPETDQVGTARPLSGGCDIGAFESETAAPAALSALAEVSGECTLSHQIIAANTNTAVGGCPAGTSHDIITLTEDITLTEPLPIINGTITIEGNGHMISGDNRFNIFVVAGRTLTINDLTLTRANAEGAGAAILVQNNTHLVVNNSTFEENSVHSTELGNNTITGGNGAAIGTQRFSGRIDINNSVFRGNSAELAGGALYFTGGTTSISGSAFTGNTGKAFGGAIETILGRLDIQNSTFSRNRSGNGGAISVTGGTATLTHLTMLDNVATFAGGQAIRQFEGSVRLRNSIVAGSGRQLDCIGTVEVSHGNFSKDGSCALTSGGDPQLGEMTGAPGYFPPLEESPVVDAADAEFCLAVDQTGKRRPIGAGCDIGAFESATAAPAAQSALANVSSECTLSNQIIAANTNTAVGGCPAGTSHDIITLTEDITLNEPLPQINGTITIEGNGHTISGDNRFRIFMVTGRKLTINNLTLTQARADGSGGAILVQNNAELVVNNSTFESNRINMMDDGDRRIIGYGGAIGTTRFNGRVRVNNSKFTNNIGDSGGAIGINGGSADIRGSAFTGNEASGVGGAIDISGVPGSRISIQNSTFSGNRSANGAIYIYGATATMTHLTMLDNTSTHNDGAAIHVSTTGTALLRNSIIAGGGLGPDCSGNINVSHGNFSEDGSCARLPGGDPMLGPLTGSPGYLPLLDGSPAVDAADAAYCLETDQTGTTRPQGGGCDAGAFESMTAAPAEASAAPTECTLSYKILSANTNTAVGGCPAGTSHDIITLTEDITLSEPLPFINGTITIEGNGHTISGDNRFNIFVATGRTLTINDLTLARANAEGSGAAILVQNNTHLVVNNSTFEGNSARNIELGDNRFTGGYGAAIGTKGFNGRIEINNSVFRDNSAELAGGALYFTGGITSISGSTFTGNTGQGFGGAIESTRGRLDIQNSTFSSNRSSNGGAISIFGGTVTLTHLTMLDNQSTYGEGDAIRLYEGSVRLRNSIVFSHSGSPDCFGNVNVSRGNFSQDGTCASANSGDPQLGEMTGAPGYFPPLEESPVIDAADAEFCLPVDQSGKRRPIGAGCDIGAIEWGTATEASPASIASAADASTCAVTTTAPLNFRDGPSGNRIGLVPTNTSLAVVGSAPGWFNVEHGGASGWISADYVTTTGDCG